MRISFVVPAFNEEAYLSACVESILRQTRVCGVSTEIVVVNNASNDRTREIALAFSEVKLVDEPRKGLTHARQAGFDACTGELIANVDADSRLPDLAIPFYGEDTDIARRLNEIGEVRFTFDLKMLSSARRLKKEGIFTMAWKYSVNYLWTTFLERPFTHEHLDVREQAEG